MIAQPGQHGPALAVVYRFTRPGPQPGRHLGDPPAADADAGAGVAAEFGVTEQQAGRTGLGRAARRGAPGHPATARRTVHSAVTDNPAATELAGRRPHGRGRGREEACVWPGGPVLDRRPRRRRRHGPLLTTPVSSPIRCSRCNSARTPARRGGTGRGQGQRLRPTAGRDRNRPTDRAGATAGRGPRSDPHSAGDTPQSVTVADPASRPARLGRAVTDNPQASLVLGRVLRITEALPVSAALDVESFAYSTLLGGPEFRRWLDRRGARPPGPRWPSGR